MNGNDILVKFNGTAIAAAKSAEITTKVDIVETASPTDGAWKDHIAGRKEWSVTVGYLVTSDAGLANLLTIGNKFTLVICGRGNNATTLSGLATLTTCRITATRGNLVQGSFQFQGAGELE